MGYLLRKTGDSMWSQLKRETTTATNNSWKRTMKACPSLNDVIMSPEWWSRSCQGWHLSYYSVTQFLPYRMEMFTLPHHTVSYTLHLDSYRTSPLWDYGKSQNQLCFTLFLRQILTTQPQLAWKSHCRPACLEIQRSAYLCYLSTGFKGMVLHAQLQNQAALLK